MLLGSVCTRACSISDVNWRRAGPGPMINRGDRSDGSGMVVADRRGAASTAPSSYTSS